MKALPAIAALLLAAAPCTPASAADPPSATATATPSEWRQLIPRASYTARDEKIAAHSKTLSASNPTRFQAHTHRSASGQEMPYRLFKPADIAPGTRLPLILVLHGGGSRGTDNLAHIAGKHASVTNGLWTLPEYQAAHPCLVLSPQCPPDPAAWTDTDWAADTHPHQPAPTAPMKLVLEILDAVMKDPAVDPQRIYVIGASMGGYGTWDILTRRPTLFAAAVPVCGALAQGQARTIAHIPVWIFHGASDELVPVSHSRSAYRDLLATGGHPRYSEYENASHYISNYAWTEPGLADWLFQQKRTQKAEN